METPTVGIIDNAEGSSEIVQNKPKTLEEPLSGTVIILAYR